MAKISGSCGKYLKKPRPGTGVHENKAVTQKMTDTGNSWQLSEE
jgi:hypothetical protein